MLKVFLLILPAALFLGCSQGAKQSSSAQQDTTAIASQPSADEAQAAEAQLRAVYTDVFAWYDRAQKDISLINKLPDFDAQYLSSSYLALKKQVERIDSAEVADGMIGFFDSGHWVCGQDISNIGFTIKSVKLVAEGKCRAEVQVKNCNMLIDLELPLVCENSTWKIDDFINNGSSEKESMKEYIENGND